jgi:hypothetical protein
MQFSSPFTITIEIKPGEEVKNSSLASKIGDYSRQSQPKNNPMAKPAAELQSCAFYLSMCKNVQLAMLNWVGRACNQPCFFRGFRYVSGRHVHPKELTQ